MLSPQIPARSGPELSQPIEPTSAETRDALAFSETGKWLARDVSEKTGAAYADVWRELTQLPDEMLALLASAVGCATLGMMLSHRLGCSAPYSPTVH